MVKKKTASKEHKTEHKTPTEKKTPHKKSEKNPSSNLLPAIVLVTIVVILAILAISLSPSVEQPEDDDRIAVAQVNGELIYDNEVLQMSVALQQQGQQVPPSIVLNQTIFLELLEQEAASNGIEVTQEQVDQIYNEQYTNLVSQITKESFEAQLAASDMTMEMFETNAKEAIRQDFIIGQLLEQKVYSLIQPVTQDEAFEYYQANPEQFQQREESSASHILVCFQGAERCEESRTQDEALSLIQDVASQFDGDNFAELAQEFSDGPTGVNGGDLGTFAKGQMVPEFEEVAFSQEIGEISEPVLTPFGYHLILVTDRSSGGLVAYDTAQDFIIQQLTQNALRAAEQNYITGLYQSAEIVIY